MKEFIQVKKNESNGQKYINLPSDSAFEEGQKVKISDPRHDLEKNTDVNYTEIDKLISDLEQSADRLAMEGRKNKELVATNVAEAVSQLAITARIQHRKNNDVEYNPKKVEE